MSRTTRLHSLSLDSKKRSFDGVGHQQCQGRHVFAVYLWTPRNDALMESVISSDKDDKSSHFIFGRLQETMLSWSRSSAVSKTTRFRILFLDSKKRRFDGVGHQQYQARHVFAVCFWTPRNEALMELVISSIKDGTSSQFISGHQETKV